MISRDEVIGYLTLDSWEPNAYSTSNAVLTQTFAYQAAAAISNASLYEETRRRLRELEVINRISSTLRSSVTEDEMLPALLKDILDAIGTTSGSIWLSENNTGSIKQAASADWFNNLHSSQVKEDQILAGSTQRLDKPYLIVDFSDDPSFSNIIRSNIPEGWNGAGLPIRTSNELLGFIFVAIRNPRQLTKAEFGLPATIAEVAGNAIHRAVLYSRSEQQVERLTALRDVDIAISSSFDLRTTLDAIIDHVMNQLRVDAARILLFNSNTQTLDLSVSRGFRVTLKQERRVRYECRDRPASTVIIVPVVNFEKYSEAR